MQANPNRFWIAVILLGWSFDFLFWKKPFGLNFFIFVTLCLVTGMYLLNADGLRLARRGSLLLFPIAFLSAMTFLRLEPMTAFLSVATTLFLMGVFAITYLGGQWMRYRMDDYIVGFLQLAGSVIARPLRFMADVRSQKAEDAKTKAAGVWAIVRGVLFAIPVIAFFAALLSSADLVFGKRLQDFIELFKLENLPEYIFRLVYILVFAYAFAGIFLHAAQKSASERVSEEDKTGEYRLLGFTEASIIMSGLGILFAAFVLIQFQYFFGGQRNIHIDGYTYSEYARRGFGELVTVAFFSLLFLLAMGLITRRETETQKRIFSSLGIILVGLVIVMQVSAFQRLVLYETAYGFSRLRTYTHVFMIWLGLLLVVTAILEVARRERAFAFAALLTALGFIVSLNLLNVDAFIVRRNVQREISGRAESPADSRVGLDTEYFVNLSDDAIPPLVDAFSGSELPVAVKEKIGVALVCLRDTRETNSKEYPWQSFHVARWSADYALQTIDKDLSAYQIVDTDYPGTVQTPSGQEYHCSAYYGD
jgi:hypothetical protein